MVGKVGMYIVKMIGHGN